MRCRVTIEFLDEPTTEPIVLENYDVECAQERGVARVYNAFSPNCDSPIAVNGNGQYRFSLKGWQGCDSYDSFQAETVIGL